MTTRNPVVRSNPKIHSQSKLSLYLCTPWQKLKPMVPPRLPARNVIATFSTFAQFKDRGWFEGWGSDRQLKWGMEQLVKQDPGENHAREYWVFYFHKIWQENFRCESPPARKHLYAYLQEPCYQAAARLYNKHKDHTKDYTFADYFHLAICHIDQILATFDRKISSVLAGFAYRSSCNFIIDEIRKIIKTFGHSDWSLLRQRSRSSLEKILIASGLSFTVLNNCLNAFDCFRVIYAPSERKPGQQLPPPTELEWQQIAEQYNRCYLIENKEADASVTTIEEVKKLLQACVKAIRNYYTPPVLSLDQPLDGEDESITWGNRIEDPSSNPVETEQQTEIWEEINTVLTKILDEIKHQAIQEPVTKQVKQAQETLEILRLYYSMELTEAEVAAEIYGDQCKYYNVNYRLKVVRKKMIEATVQWAKTNYNLLFEGQEINSTEQIELVRKLVDAWLYRHYQKNIVLGE